MGNTCTVSLVRLNPFVSSEPCPTVAFDILQYTDDSLFTASGHYFSDTLLVPMGLPFQSQQ